MRFRLTLPKLPSLDARELVGRAGDAARDALRAALLEGVDPATGQRRETNSAGKPKGLRTGTLANGLRRTGVTGSAASARTTVIPPASRAAWVADQGDVIVADGRVADAVRDAANEYLEEL